MDQFETAKTGSLEWFLEHEKNGTLPDLMEPDSDGWHLHEYASENGHLNVVKYLVEDCPQRVRIEFPEELVKKLFSIEDGVNQVLKNLTSDTFGDQFISKAQSTRRI